MEPTFKNENGYCNTMFYYHLLITHKMKLPNSAITSAEHIYRAGLILLLDLFCTPGSMN